MAEPTPASTSSEFPFGPLETSVIQLAEQEPASVLDRHPLVRRWTRRIFGVGQEPRLANPRLEALRELVAQLAHRPDERLEPEIIAAHERGITDEQIDWLSKHYRQD